MDIHVINHVINDKIVSIEPIFESHFGIRILNLEKTDALHISELIIELVCRTFLMFSRLQRPKSNADFTYLDHVRVTSRKFFRNV